MASLKEHIEMYEKGDLDALDQILSSSVSNMPDNGEEITIVSDLDEVDDDNGSPSGQNRPNNATPIDGQSQNDQHNQNQQYEASGESTSTPQLTREIKKEIGQLTNEWVRLQEGLQRINKMKTQFRKEQQTKEQVLKHYIDKYRLKDITKGKHKLVPQLKKGGKKGFNKRVIHTGLADFLNEIGLDDPETVAEQATEYLDGCREKLDDCVILRHETI